MTFFCRGFAHWGSSVPRSFKLLLKRTPLPMAPDKYETVEAVLDKAGTEMIIRRESVSEPPN